MTVPYRTSLPLQVFNQLASVLSKCDVSIHLVEVSPKLSAIQAEMLTGGKVQPNPENKSAYMKGISKTGIPIYWYRDIQDVPQGKGLLPVTSCYSNNRGQLC